MVRINWTLQSVSDLKNIAEYISRDSKKYAKLQANRIRNRTKILKHQTHSGKIVPEINQQNIRELIEGNSQAESRFVRPQLPTASFFRQERAGSALPLFSWPKPKAASPIRNSPQ